MHPGPVRTIIAGTLGRMQPRSPAMIVRLTRRRGLGRHRRRPIRHSRVPLLRNELAARRLDDAATLPMLALALPGNLARDFVPDKAFTALRGVAVGVALLDRAHRLA